MTQHPPTSVTPHVDETPVPGQPKKGLAITSLVFGIVGWTICPFVGAVVALVTGIIALVQASNRPEQYGGRGHATAGIVLAILGLIVVPPMLVAILLPSLARAREITKRAVSASNLRVMGQAMQVYAADSNGAFPPDLDVLLMEGTIPRDILQNPSNTGRPRGCDYYYVVGLRETDPANWIVMYGDPADHGGEGANILFVGGQVRFVKEPRFSSRIEDFEADYVQQRGHPPEVILPR